jgi:acyl dehydratase
VTVVINDLDELRARTGEHLGYSEWLKVTQDRIDAFADATGDRQWIHTDTDRAAAGPFGGTIAHGYLTLALVIPMWSQIVEFRGIRMAVNYGINKLRFPAPVPSGAQVRLGATLAAVNDMPDGAEAVVDAVIECQGSPKPACVAQTVYRYYTV